MHQQQLLTLAWFVIPVLVMYEKANSTTLSYLVWVVSRHLTYIVAVIFVVCEEELFGCIWDWVL